MFEDHQKTPPLISSVQSWLYEDVARYFFRGKQTRWTALAAWIGLCGLALVGGCRNFQKTTANSPAAKRPAASTASNAKPTTRVSVVPGRGTLPETIAPTAAPDVAKASKETRVGEVRVIGAARRFVLIEVLPRPDLPTLSPGLELRTRAPARAASGGEQTGTLRVSPERRQPFIVADVIDGEPHLEDRVYYSAENQPRLLPAILTMPAYLSTPAPVPTGNGDGDGSSSNNSDPTGSPHP